MKHVIGMGLLAGLPATVLAAQSSAPSPLSVEGVTQGFQMIIGSQCALIAAAILVLAGVIIGHFVWQSAL